MQSEADSFAKTLTSTVVEDGKEEKQITNATVLRQDDYLYMELLGQGAFGKVRKCRPKNAGW